MKFSCVYSHKYMKSTKQTYFIHSTEQIYKYKWNLYSYNSTQSYQCIYIWASFTTQSVNMYIGIKCIYKLKMNNTDVCSLKIKSTIFDKYLFFNVICLPCQCTSFNDQNWSYRSNTIWWKIKIKIQLITVSAYRHYEQI